jgi:hypothetical protein
MFRIRESSNLLPNPFDSEASAARFCHRDVADMPSIRLWGESIMLEHELAARLWLRERPRVLVGWPDIIDDQQWLTARIRAIRGELRRRRVLDAPFRR